MCVFLHIHNKYTQYTHILCKQKHLFCVRLIAINRLTAQLQCELLNILKCIRKESWKWCLISTLKWHFYIKHVKKNQYNSFNTIKHTSFSQGYMLLKQVKLCFFLQSLTIISQKLLGKYLFKVNSSVVLCLLCNICVAQSQNTRCAFSASFSKRNLIWSEWRFVIVEFSAHTTKLLARIKSGLSLQRVGEGACICTCVSVRSQLLAWKCMFRGYRLFNEHACSYMRACVGLKSAFAG